MKFSLVLSMAAAVGCCATAGAQSSASAPQVPVQVQFRQALELAQRGDAVRALDAVDKLLDTHRNFVPAWKLKGSLLEDSGRQVDAAEAYEKGLKLAPSDADLLYKVGVYQLVAGDRVRSATLLGRYVRLEPKDGDGWFYLAQADHLTNHDDQALIAIRNCLKIKPDNPSVWQKYGELLVSTGDGENGFSWLEKAYHTDPRLDRIEYDLGIASLDRMDLQNAEQFAERAAAAHPDDLNALHLLASVELKLSHWQEARTGYDRILSMKPGDIDAMLGSGRCQLELKQNQPAIDTLTHLLSVDPANILAHYYLSRAYAAMGDAAEAQHQAELHQKMVEQTSFASSALGSEQDRAVWSQARKLVQEGHEDQALALFRHDSRGAPVSPGQPYFLVGALNLYLGNRAEGIHDLQRALALDPKIRGAHTYLGIVDLQQDRLDDAETEFAAELANDPNYQTAVAELGVVRYRQQRWKQAADQLSRSHTRSPALLVTLSDAYFHLGMMKDADLAAELAAAYAKDDPAILDSLNDLLTRNGETELAHRLSGSAQH
jgi:tetratricopeptide (TPR) repeat protein